jgi:hypothetical protein
MNFRSPVENSDSFKFLIHAEHTVIGVGLSGRPFTRPFSHYICMLNLKSGRQSKSFTQIRLFVTVNSIRLCDVRPLFLAQLFFAVTQISECSRFGVALFGCRIFVLHFKPHFCLHHCLGYVGWVEVTGCYRAPLPVVSPGDRPRNSFSLF